MTWICNIFACGSFIIFLDSERAVTASVVYCLCINIYECYIAYCSIKSFIFVAHDFFLVNTIVAGIHQ